MAGRACAHSTRMAHTVTGSLWGRTKPRGQPVSTASVDCVGTNPMRNVSRFHYRVVGCLDVASVATLHLLRIPARPAWDLLD